VIQREVGLDDYVEDAVHIDAALNRKLLYSIFAKSSPLTMVRSWLKGTG